MTNEQGPRRHMSSITSTCRTVDGDFTCYMSANYLGLTIDPYVVERTVASVRRYGTSLLTGHASDRITEQWELEERLAEVAQKDACCVTTSGYVANVVALSQMARSPTDIVFFDDHIHHSVRNAVALAKCKGVAFKHNDFDSLTEQISAARRNGCRRVIIVTEGTFSADGDFGNVTALAKLKERSEIFVLMDESHSLGIGTNHGGGCLQKLVLNSNLADVITGSFGKTFASSGGYILGSKKFVEQVQRHSLPYLLTTGLTPAAIVAALAAVESVGRRDDLHRALAENISLFNDRAVTKRVDLRLSQSASPIFTVFSSSSASQLGEHLQDCGILAQVLRFPAVPRGADRVRIFLNAVHSQDQIIFLTDSIEKFELP